MGEAQKKTADNSESNLELDGLEQIFDSPGSAEFEQNATTAGAVDATFQHNVERLIERFGELVTLGVDQKHETAKMGVQLIENQRQLIATQQILIRLMERSIELTRHISSIEERLPTIFELPRIVESLRQRIAQIEGIDEQVK
jgi:hypothetical protein